jgi:hypothetical protein
MKSRERAACRAFGARFIRHEERLLLIASAPRGERPARPAASARATAIGLESTMKFADEEGIRKVFDLHSPTEMLKKLRWEQGQIEAMLAVEDPNVIFAAFNAAATAWHMIDWIKTYSRIHPNMGLPCIDTKTYRDSVIARCPELSICRQISVGWKHRIVDQFNNPGVQALHVIDIYMKFENGLPVPGARPAYSQRRPAIYSGTQSIALDSFFRIVTEFWIEELERLKFPTGLANA